MSNRRSRSRSPRRRRSSGGSPISRSRQYPSSPSRTRTRTFSEGGRDRDRERERDREGERARVRDRRRDRGRGWDRNRGSGRDWQPNRRGYERRNRGVEQERGWEGHRKREGHSPHREMDIGGVRRIASGGAKDTPGERNVRDNGDHYQWRKSAGRGRGWDSNRNNSSRGRASRLSDQSSDEAGDTQGLLESLIDPQEVPRSGEYYEHDNRDAPPGQQRRPRQSMPSARKRWSPPTERWGRNHERGARFRRHSSDERIWRRDRGRERDRWERRGQDDSWRSFRGGWEEKPMGGGKWKHDMFEQLEKEEQELEGEEQAETSMVEPSNDSEGKWAHDKFEEMEASAMDNVVAMDTDA